MRVLLWISGLMVKWIWFVSGGSIAARSHLSAVEMRLIKGHLVVFKSKGITFIVTWAVSCMYSYGSQSSWQSTYGFFWFKYDHFRRRSRRRRGWALTERIIRSSRRVGSGKCFASLCRREANFCDSGAEVGRFAPCSSRSLIGFSLLTQELAY